MKECGSDYLPAGDGVTDAATDGTFARHYSRLTDGRHEWLSVHLAPDAITPFGARLL